MAISFSQGQQGLAFDVDALAGEVISGQAGMDNLQGGTGDDTLDGGAGNDTLYGGGGRDTILFGRGDGNDLLRYSDNDTLQFKPGITPADVLFTRSLDGNTLFAHITGSLNTVEIRSETQFSDFAVQFADGSRVEGTALLARSAQNERIEAQGASGQRFDGGAGDDWMTVKAPPSDRIGSAVNLFGGDGRDVLISGYRSYDTLEGGAGDDTLVSGSDTRLMDGGAGRDVYTFEGVTGFVRTTTLVLEGEDELWAFNPLWDGGSTDLTPAQLLNFARRGDNEAVLTFNGTFQTELILRNADQLGLATLRFRDGTVFAGADLVAMLKPYVEVSGSDNLMGTAANDSMTGSSGNDTFYGGGGDDTMRGGLGADTYTDSISGHDVLYIDSADTIEVGYRLLSDVVLLPRDAARPDDLVVSFLGSTDTVTIVDARQSANVSVKFGDQSVTLGTLLSRRDAPADMLLNGTSGHDTLVGGLGRDTLKGGSGNDLLSGLRGDDRIEGGLGKDTLVGGQGNDLLIGDRGNDTYKFAVGDGQDTIIDNDLTWFNSDALQISGASSKQLWLTHQGKDLVISIIGTQDSVTIQDWYSGISHQVEKITAGDGKTLSSSKVNALVNAMSAFAPPAAGQTVLPANVDAALSKIVASSWR